MRYRKFNWGYLYCFRIVLSLNDSIKFLLDKYGWDGSVEIKIIKYLMKFGFGDKWICFKI